MVLWDLVVLINTVKKSEKKGRKSGFCFCCLLSISNQRKLTKQCEERCFKYTKLSVLLVEDKREQG